MHQFIGLVCIPGTAGTCSSTTTLGRFQSARSESRQSANHPKCEQGKGRTSTLSVILSFSGMSQKLTLRLDPRHRDEFKNTPGIRVEIQILTSLCVRERDGHRGSRARDSGLHPIEALVGATLGGADWIVANGVSGGGVFIGDISHVHLFATSVVEDLGTGHDAAGGKTIERIVETLDEVVRI